MGKFLCRRAFLIPPPSPSHCGAVLVAVLSSAGLSVVASGCDGLGAPPGPCPSLSPGPLPAEACGLLCLCGAFASGASRACHQRSQGMPREEGRVSGRPPGGWQWVLAKPQGQQGWWPGAAERPPTHMSFPSAGKSGPRSCRVPDHVPGRDSLLLARW